MFNLKTHLPFVVWILLLLGHLLWVLELSEPYIMKIILIANFIFQLTMYIWLSIKERLNEENV